MAASGRQPTLRITEAIARFSGLRASCWHATPSTISIPLSRLEHRQWVKARYVAERDVIARRHSDTEWEIIEARDSRRGPASGLLQPVGAPSTRHDSCEGAAG